jgi:hypothetical protein
MSGVSQKVQMENFREKVQNVLNSTVTVSRYRFGWFMVF